MLLFLQARGIQLGDLRGNKAGGIDLLSLAYLESHHPSGARVYLDDSSTLHWPVMFLYPEYAESDYIMDCNENNRFGHHYMLLHSLYSVHGFQH